MAAVVAAALTATLLTAGMAGGSSGGNSGPDLLVLTDNGVLSQYDARRPLLPERQVRITGLGRDKLIGIDVRPATGAVYALGRSGQLYTVDRKGGAAAAVGMPNPLPGNAIGFDFNPTVDRIRVVTGTGQNFRLNPDTGAIAGTDTALAYAPGDRAEGKQPKLAASGYTNSVAGATATALYGIDSRADSLVLQGSVPGAQPVVSPNTGQLFTVGRLGLDITALNGFDVAGSADPAGHNPDNYRAFAAVRTSFGLPLLVKVDLRTGRTAIVTVLRGKPIGLTIAG
jgi:hypothetical protein